MSALVVFPAVPALFAQNARNPAPNKNTPVQSNRQTGDRPLTLTTFAEAARNALPGVVSIKTEEAITAAQDFFTPSGALSPTRSKNSIYGSGFILSTDGYVLTNNHVVGKSDVIRVTLHSGEIFLAKLVGRDARMDVALLKIEVPETLKLTALPLGDSDQLNVGEFVVAIGSPYKMPGTVTTGILSFKNRRVAGKNWSIELIQTETPLNRGNSGGPLLTTDGEVIGINTMIVTDNVTSTPSGLNFAFPINPVKAALEELKTTGKVARGWLGVSASGMSEELAKKWGLKENKGVILSEVTAGAAAEKAGLRAGDVLLTVDGQEVNDGPGLADAVSARRPGAVVRLEVFRDGREFTVSVPLGVFPTVDERFDAPLTLELSATHVAAAASASGKRRGPFD